MAENNTTKDQTCPKSEEGKHLWEIKLDSPGHHGEKKLVEVFVCQLCGMKKPVKTPGK